MKSPPRAPVVDLEWKLVADDVSSAFAGAAGAYYVNGSGYLFTVRDGIGVEGRFVATKSSALAVNGSLVLVQAQREFLLLELSGGAPIAKLDWPPHHVRLSLVPSGFLVGYVDSATASQACVDLLATGDSSLRRVPIYRYPPSAKPGDGLAPTVATMVAIGGSYWIGVLAEHTLLARVNGASVTEFASDGAGLVSVGDELWLFRDLARGIDILDERGKALRHLTSHVCGGFVSEVSSDGSLVLAVCSPELAAVVDSGGLTVTRFRTPDSANDHVWVTQGTIYHLTRRAQLLAAPIPGLH
jgi:hypothetical protein